MIAISYRRDDSLSVAGRLYDRLQAEFGKENVLMDFDSVPYGIDFREHIRNIIKRSKVLIAVIGPDWLGQQSDGSSRIAAPTDLVRFQIEYTLKSSIPVIPVLIDNTPMPKIETLPSSINELAFRNALTLHTGEDFHHDTDRLVAALRSYIKEIDDVAFETVASPEASVSEAEVVEEHERRFPGGAKEGFGNIFGDLQPVELTHRRLKDLEAIKRSLLNVTRGIHQQLVGICGAPGVGKSTLAHALAQDVEVRHSFTDGVFYLRLQPELDPFEQVRIALSGALSKKTSTPFELPQILAEYNVLLVFDDVEFESSGSFAVISSLGQYSSVLVVTRDRDVLEKLGAEIHSLDGPLFGKESSSDIVEDKPSDQRPAEASTAYHKTYSAFIPDRTAYGRRGSDAPLDDALGVRVYAGHLAQLIAAKETWMPLSIGLFGAWGAGKSHFIDLLDEHLRALTRESGKVFHRQIVQIRFNAWHYLDTNLWANLVCEIFDQLFAKLEERRDTKPEQVDKLRSELAKQSALAAEAKEALKTAETARVDAEEKLRVATQERETEERTVGALLDDLKTLVTDKSVSDQLHVVAEGLGLPNLEESFAELQTRAREVRTLSGRTRALVLAILTGPGLWKRGLLLAVALAAPLGVAWLAANGTTSIQGLLAGTGRTIGQLVAAIAALSAWLSSQVKAGNSLVSKVENAYDKVKKARTEREAKDDAALALKALAVKRQAEEQARHTLHEAEEKMKTIHAELAELAPGRQLIRFLKERASAEDYRRHLGLVSVVRRDFEQLSQLLIGAAEGKDDSLPQIDRIVLYIDDLDRCRADRVIEVLEAVHLLLAFPLFAVVVAVDPRWLRQSLLDHYPRLLGRGDEDVKTRGATLGRAATPQDYLEKIFQVPFNLQAMEKTGFDTLVALLFPIAKTPAEDMSRAQVPSTAVGAETALIPPMPPASEIATLQAVAHEASREGEPVPSTRISTEPVKQPPPDPQRLTLTEKEVMDVHRFQPLFQTPRALKRLANTYCLIRVGVDEGDWSDYVGAGDTPGIYRIPMLLLAVTSAFPALARPWLIWLRETPPKVWQLANKDIASLTAKYIDTTDGADWNRLAQCFNQLDLSEWPLPEPTSLAKWVPRVARYSF